MIFLFSSSIYSTAILACLLLSVGIPKENQYIKQLPAIMQQLNPEKVKASKKIKEQYGIFSAGFPYLFGKNPDI